MVYFNWYILCTAPLALTRFQPLYQAIASVVLKHSCNHIRIAAFHFGIAAKPVVVEQHLSNLAVFLRILHNKIFSLTVLLNDSADSCPVFSGKGLEHTVSHYIVEVVEDRHIVCEPVVIVQSTDFCVVLVQDFQIIQVQQAGAPDRFPNLFISVLFVVFNLEGMII